MFSFKIVFSDANSLVGNLFCIQSLLGGYWEEFV